MAYNSSISACAGLLTLKETKVDCIGKTSSEIGFIGILSSAKSILMALGKGSVLKWDKFIILINKF
jgi:hypothetical protein